MNIVHIASEIAPIAKAGGLADVVLGLARSFKTLGHNVSVILPKYSFLSSSKISSKKVSSFSFTIYEKTYSNQIYVTEVEDISVYLIEPDSNDFFKGDKIYQGKPKKDTIRFTYFSKAAVEYLNTKQDPIDVIHLHDWHSSLVAPLIHLQNKDTKPKIVLTVHNLSYQGKCRFAFLQNIGIPAPKVEPFSVRKYNLFKRACLLKGGILYSDATVLVSPSYAKEIFTKSKACGLLSFLKKQRHKIQGILNGIDNTIWDPEKDEALPFKYSKNLSINEILLARRKNKEHLQKKLGLNVKDVPLIACVSRLASQKGPKLIRRGLLYAAKKDSQAILLGSSSTHFLQKKFETLAQKYKANRDIHFHFQFDDELSRLIYGSADFLIVPSYFEPCGLAQLIALRYGCVPIVRKTGGLKDTIFDINDSVPGEQKNGFTFQSFTPRALLFTIDRALHQHFKDRCKTLVENGMRMNYSWEKSASEYLKIYTQKT